MARKNQTVNFGGSGASVSDMASYMGQAERTIPDQARKMENEFTLRKIVVRQATKWTDLPPQNGGGGLDIYTYIRCRISILQKGELEVPPFRMPNAPTACRRVKKGGPPP